MVLRPRTGALLVLATACVAFASQAVAEIENSEVLNGFDLKAAAVPRGLILAGGPPRDGIRSVDAPSFVKAEEAVWVVADTPVIGVVVGETARAYPVHLLEYHQIVNDRIGEQAFAVTYDPLSGSPLVFDATVDGQRLEFGVSGLVYESNFLLYDRQTQSLWSQLLGEAVSGPLKGTKLVRLRCRQEAFGVWQHRHPESSVLERPELKKIDYRHSPFSAYWVSKKIAYPVSTTDERFHPKELVLGVEAGGEARAYLGSLMVEAGGRVVDEVGGHKIHIAYDVDVGAFSWKAPEGVEVTDAYWFAWKTFHPDTEIWTPTGAAP